MKSGFVSGIFIVIIIAVCSCNSNGHHNTDENVDHKDSVNITAAPFKTADGWGYNVMVDNKVFINQSIIPGIQGIKSFASEQDAAKVGNLIITKIKAHQRPIIVIADLKALGIQ